MDARLVDHVASALVGRSQSVREHLANHRERRAERGLHRACLLS